MICWRRLRDWQGAGVWTRLHRVLLDRLGQADQLDWERACHDRASITPPGYPAKKGGPTTGPDLTNRGKAQGAPRTKRHLFGLSRHPTRALSDRSQRPRQYGLCVPPRRYPPNQAPTRPTPKAAPLKLHAGKVYDLPRCRQALSRRRIKVRIARKGIETSQRLGRHRWVVARTLAWLGQFRRLTIRSERRVAIHEAFLALGCSLICFRSLKQF